MDQKKKRNTEDLVPGIIMLVLGTIAIIFSIMSARYLISMDEKYKPEILEIHEINSNRHITSTSTPQEIERELKKGVMYSVIVDVNVDGNIRTVKGTIYDYPKIGNKIHVAKLTNGHYAIWSPGMIFATLILGGFISIIGLYGSFKIFKSFITGIPLQGSSSNKNDD